MISIGVSLLAEYAGKMLAMPAETSAMRPACAKIPNDNEIIK
jgi:hypothetical protein